jgi:hypothetical protein
VAASGQATFDSSQKLAVQVVAVQNMAVVRPDPVQVDPAKLGRSVKLTFDVQGTHPGPGELCVLLRQECSVLLSLILNPQIVETAATGASQIEAAEEGRFSNGTASRYPLLQILQHRDGDRTNYHFILQMGGGRAYEAASRPLEAKPDDYVEQIHKRIEERWLISGKERSLFFKELRVLGGELFDELIPPEIQNPLWEARYQLKTIRVYSTEPFIPWELVHLKEPQQPGRPSTRLPSKDHFLAQKGLVRWLFGVGSPAETLPLRKGRRFHMVPEYRPPNDLPSAQEEIPFLQRELATTALTTPAALDKLLRTGDFDLLHFSGHGEAGARGRSRILLGERVQDGQSVAEYLEEKMVDQLAKLNTRRPLVVLNACQIGQGNLRLTNIGGFPAAFLRRGAGAFVGTLWSVGDGPARTFTEGFYTALVKDKKTLAEAALAGREAARGAGDATWLAYVVYGDPDAIVVPTEDGR